MPLTKDLIHSSLEEVKRDTRIRAVCRTAIPASWIWDARDALKSPKSLASIADPLCGSCYTVHYQPTGKKEGPQALLREKTALKAPESRGQLCHLIPATVPNFRAQTFWDRHSLFWSGLYRSLDWHSIFTHLMKVTHSSFLLAPSEKTKSL